MKWMNKKKNLKEKSMTCFQKILLEASKKKIRKELKKVKNSVDFMLFLNWLARARKSGIELSDKVIKKAIEKNADR